MRKILFCDTHPFGTLTDMYKWCDYLKSKYDITLVCLDDNERIQLNGVNIKRVRKSQYKIIRGLTYILTCLWYIMFFRGIIFVVYFEHCDVLKRFFPWKKMHLDFRTGSVSSDNRLRNQQNMKMAKCSKCFNSVSVISEELNNKLGLSNAYYLPLGADSITKSSHVYFPLKLLYVGTLNGRRIEDTLIGLSMYIKSHPNSNIKYSIIGSGFNNEEQKLNDVIKEYGLQEYVTLYGRINHSELNSFFKESNVGVSYVPINDYYNIQPPTKTFEYTMSGLFCLATATIENKKIISSSNGYLISDSPESFYEGLEFITANYGNINELAIRDSLKNYTWSCIIEQYMEPMLTQL